MSLKNEYIAFSAIGAD